MNNTRALFLLLLFIASVLHFTVYKHDEQTLPSVMHLRQQFNTTKKNVKINTIENTQEGRNTTVRNAEHSSSEHGQTEVEYKCGKYRPLKTENHNGFHQTYSKTNKNTANLFQKGKKSPLDCSGMRRMGEGNYKNFVVVVAKMTGMKSGDNIFEAGAGCGAFSYFLKRTLPKSHFYGVDYVQSMLNVARLALPNDGPFCQADIRNYNFVPSNSMDHVVSVAVFEYLPDNNAALQALKEMARVAKDGATITTVMNNDKNAKVKGQSYRNKLFQTHDWWQDAAKSLGLTDVRIFLEKDIYTGPSDVWAAVGRFSVFMKKNTRRGNRLK